MAGHVARVGRGKVRTWFWWGNMKERAHLEDPGVDGRIILKWIFKKWNGDINWINLAQKRDRCRALVNTVMKFLVS